MAKPNDHSATQALAWRKKPRKWAPKSRHGCRTCKIRRIKCDLSHPSCQKCTSTGRTCDGYTTTTTTSPPNTYTPPPIQPLRPLLTLPLPPTHAPHLSFFTSTSLPSLLAYRTSSSWLRSLAYFAHTSPPVHHAALALASLHRAYADRASAPAQAQYLKAWARSSASLRWYNEAIRLLPRAGCTGKKMGGGGGGEEGGVDVHASLTTLLVCYLFICYEHLAGEDVRALRHLSAGMKVLRGLRGALRGGRVRVAGEVREVVAQVGRQMRRLDGQVVQFVRDWEPHEEEEGEEEPSGLVSGSAAQPCPFHSFDHAADTLQSLVTRVMRLRWLAASSPSSAPSPTQLSTLLSSLSAFPTHLALSLPVFSHPPSPSSLSLLHLSHTLATLLLHTASPSTTELSYDAYLPSFRAALAHARIVLASHSHPHDDPPPPSFTPETGVLPALFIIASKCRDPGVRREALGLIRSRAMREASWESGGTGRVVEWLVGVEEAGERVERQEDVPGWRRVGDISWVHCGKGRGAVDIKVRWRFDGGEEWWGETLGM